MTKENDTVLTGILRHPITSLRSCSLGVITSSHLDWKDHIARIVDLSITGVGIESSGDRYRAGINSLPLSRDKELLVQERIAVMRPNEPIHNPEVIISTILESMTRGETGSQGTPDRPDPEDLKALRSAEETSNEEDLIAGLRDMLTSL